MASDGIWDLQSITDVTNEEKQGDAIRCRAGSGESTTAWQSSGLNNVCTAKAIPFHWWGYTSKKYISTFLLKYILQWCYYHEPVMLQPLKGSIFIPPTRLNRDPVMN